jgi:phytoene dehydrogenase-like protein
MPDVVVIGAGLNGLVAAAVLAGEKLSPLVIERQPAPGGAMASANLGSDCLVPRLTHALGPIRPEIVRALKLDRAGIEFITPDPSMTSFGTHGETVTLHPDPVLTAAAIDRVSKKDAGTWRTFLHDMHRIARVVDEINQHPPPAIDRVGPDAVWRLLRLGRRARALGRRDVARLVRWLSMPVADLLTEWFETDLLSAAIATRAILGNFAGPRSGGTAGVLLQRLADDGSPVGSGVTARGGPAAVATALAAIVAERGGAVRTAERVVRVIVRDGRAAGVELESGARIDARAVVSAVDPKQTLLSLVEPDELPPTFVERIRHVRARGVTAKINLALSALPTFPGLHGDVVPLRGRLVVGPTLDYLEHAFDAAKYGEISPQPWLEIALPSVIDTSLASGGRHVASIYAQFAPRHLRHGEWRDRRADLYQAVVDAIAPHAPDLSSLVIDREVLTPEDLESEWGLSGGHLFHGEPALDQSWMARPLLGWSQYRTPIDGLYLASAGTHPGGGLTGTSGWLAARTVARDLKRRR